jgi:hypothetical protein
MSRHDLVYLIASAMSDAVWARAEGASHRPEPVSRWWLDANARYNLAEAVADGLIAAGKVTVD